MMTGSVEVGIYKLIALDTKLLNTKYLVKIS